MTHKHLLHNKNPESLLHTTLTSNLQHFQANHRPSRGLTLGSNLGYGLIKSFRIFLVCFASITWSYAECTLPKDLVRLHVNDKQLKDEDNRVVILHGLNEVNKRPPYKPSYIGFDDNNIEFIRKYGFNVIRLGFVWAAFEPSPGIYDSSYLDDFQKTVNALAKQGIYTLIDFHEDAYSTKHGGFGFPEWAALSTTIDNKRFAFPLTLFFNKATDEDFDNFWNNQKIQGKGLQEYYSNMVETVVSRFKTNPGVLGYDIMNEPFPGSLWRAYYVHKNALKIKGCFTFDTTQFASFYQRLIGVIQHADPKALVFYEPNSIFGLGMPTNLPAFKNSNLVFGFHNYAHNLETVFKNAKTHVDKVNTLPFITEFGADLMNGRQLSHFAALADKYKMSWIEWAYSNNPAYPISHLPMQAPPDSRKQGIVYDPSKPLMGANVNWERLNALTRAFPQSTAGELINFAYDADSKQFTLSFYKRNHSKKPISKNPCSIIYVPAFNYKNGFKLSVQGAKVTRQVGNYLIIENTTDDDLEIVHISITAK
ncbi:MAG: cellulase family glycosylhydrolase [Legionella sp.]|nr:cellulase family glycosylhydrolase [Legionella sp.]